VAPFTPTERGRQPANSQRRRAPASRPHPSPVVRHAPGSKPRVRNASRPRAAIGSREPKGTEEGQTRLRPRRCRGTHRGQTRLRPRHAARRRCTPPTVRRDLKVAAAPLTHTERGRQPAHPNEGKRPLAGRIQSRLSKMHQGRAHEQETRRAPARPEIERAPSARRPPRHRASRPRAAFLWRTAPGRTEDPPPSSASWPTTPGGGDQRPGRAPM
jgi:hypothetical protein